MKGRTACQVRRNLFIYQSAPVTLRQLWLPSKGHFSQTRGILPSLREATPLFQHPPPLPTSRVHDKGTGMI